MVARMNEQYFLQQGYVAVRQVDDDWLGVMPMTFGKGRICSGMNEMGYEDCWCYESVGQAVTAMNAWDPAKDKEPQGWMRHPYSGRRREGGDPANEVVRM